MALAYVMMESDSVQEGCEVNGNPFRVTCDMGRKDAFGTAVEQVSTTDFRNPQIIP